MSAAKRIQRKRTKGWKLPENAVVVTRPTKWGNPFEVGAKVEDPMMLACLRSIVPALGGMTSVTVQDRQAAVDAFFEWIVQQPPLWLAARDELAGRDLACYCPLDQPCHADVLLEIANHEARAEVPLPENAS